MIWPRCGNTTPFPWTNNEYLKYLFEVEGLYTFFSAPTVFCYFVTTEKQKPPQRYSPEIKTLFKKKNRKKKL